MGIENSLVGAPPDPPRSAARAFHAIVDGSNRAGAGLNSLGLPVVVALEKLVADLRRYVDIPSIVPLEVRAGGLRYVGISIKGEALQ